MKRTLDRSEGLAACGAVVAKGWHFWKGFMWRKAGLRLCKRCAVA